MSSAGEFLQARPVIEELLHQDPDWTILLTHTSPTGVDWVKDYKQAAITSFYPFDFSSQVRKALSLIQPKAIVFIKFDIWPNLVYEASRKKIPLFLVSATLRAKSKRLSTAFARLYYHKIYSKLDVIFTVSEEDRNRFAQTNPDHPNLKVAGDTRVDSVLFRQNEFSKKDFSPLQKSLKDQFSKILIVGSSWPDDESLILPLWPRLKMKYSPNVLLILVPHEPDSIHLSDLEEKIKTLKLSSSRLSEFTSSLSDQTHFKSDVLLIDQVGQLADLYRIGTIAYVGAGKGGIHNVMEPAAWKLPIAFGPRYHNAPEAIELLKRKAGCSVRSADEFYNCIDHWLSTPSDAEQKGQIARNFLDETRGATKLTVSSLIHHINSTKGSHS